MKISRAQKDAMLLFYAMGTLGSLLFVTFLMYVIHFIVRQTVTNRPAETEN